MQYFWSGKPLKQASKIRAALLYFSTHQAVFCLPNSIGQCNSKITTPVA